MRSPHPLRPPACPPSYSQPSGCQERGADVAARMPRWPHLPLHLAAAGGTNGTDATVVLRVASAEPEEAASSHSLTGSRLSGHASRFTHCIGVMLRWRLGGVRASSASSGVPAGSSGGSSGDALLASGGLYLCESVPICGRRLLHLTGRGPKRRPFGFAQGRPPRAVSAADVLLTAWRLRRRAGGPCGWRRRGSRRPASGWPPGSRGRRGARGPRRRRGGCRAHSSSHR